MLDSHKTAHSILISDFNFHYDVDTDRTVNRIKPSLSDHNLTQLIKQPTQIHGHIIDWLIVMTSPSWTKPLVWDKQISDYYSLFCHLNTHKPKPRRTQHCITSRNLKKIESRRSKVTSEISLLQPLTFPTRTLWMCTTCSLSDVGPSCPDEEAWSDCTIYYRVPSSSLPSFKYNLKMRLFQLAYC